MKFQQLPLSGAYTIELNAFEDERGWFARTFCKKTFAKEIGLVKWVQINHSVTLAKGTIRGMHFQIPPVGEKKLIRCVLGSVYDVVVDIRQNSPTFLQWFGVELSDKNKRMLFIPEGFAHGFQTLEDNSQLIYHHSEFYEPGFEGGLRYDDKMLNIKWKLPLTNISQRDQTHPYLTKFFKGLETLKRI